MTARPLNRQPTLIGEHLLLRPLQKDDWGQLFAVASDPLIWKGHPAHDRWKEGIFRKFFADALSMGGALAVLDAGSGLIIGSSRFQNYQGADGGSVEIGWTFLARSHWGGRSNAEMKHLMLEHALAAVDRVYFIVGEGNIRSRKAMTKIGGILDGWSELRQMTDGPVLHIRFKIDRAGFANGPLARNS